MNFFRLRVINTLLLFMIGIVLGFILKDKFYPAAKPPAPAVYHPSYHVSTEVTPAAQPESEEPAQEPAAEADQEPEQETPSAAAPEKRAPGPDEDQAEPLVIEAAPVQTAAGASKRPVFRDSPEDFFRSPADYSGRDIEMDLQMITVKKVAGGWRLNLVYTGPDKKIDYLYLDDQDQLGNKPDLRIGYVYKVRFRCAKGDASSGNTLLAISPTGDKAAWATGLSAIESRRAY